MRHSYHAEQWLPYPVELLFAFFANPANLPRLMPAWQNARIEEASIVPPPRNPTPGPATIAAGAGTRMTISFRPFPYAPFRVPWEAEISEFVWNDHFCDLQLRGPFAYWKHCHSIAAATRDSIPGSTVTDHIDYELLLGILGDLAQRLFVRRQMEATFAYRRRQLITLLAVTKP